MQPLFIQAKETTLLDLVFICIRESLNRQTSTSDVEWHSAADLTYALEAQLKKVKAAEDDNLLLTLLPTSPVLFSPMFVNTIQTFKKSFSTMRERAPELDTAFAHLILALDEILLSTDHYVSFAIGKIK